MSASSPDLKRPERVGALEAQENGVKDTDEEDDVKAMHGYGPEQLSLQLLYGA